MGFIYKVYTRKKIEEFLSVQEQTDIISENITRYPKEVQKFLYDLNNNNKKVLKVNLNKDTYDKTVPGGGLDSTSEYSEKYLNDVTIGRINAEKLYNDGTSRLEEIERVKNEENIYDEYTTSDFLDVTCKTCDDVKNAYGGIGCALYYKPNGDSNLTLYYKKTDEAYNIKVSDDFKEDRISKGHLITKSSKCKEIKSLEKCKEVKSCSDIRGSYDNRKNCVLCEDPISNGTYDVYKKYPNENLIEKKLDILVQKGFPKDWANKGYKCKEDYGPFDLEGCQRGACAEDYDPPGPNTAECYSELYKNNGGVGPPTEKEWWNNNAIKQQPINFNGYIKDSEDGEFKWSNPPDGNFQSIVANISSKTKLEKEDYDSAKKAYIFKNGQVDKNKIQEFACEHQERTNKPNIDCQLKKEREVGLEPTAAGSFYKGSYNIENFSNLKEGYACTNTNTVSSNNISGKIKEYYDKFINELSVNFSTLNYENVLDDKKKIKNLGRGDKKQAALQVFGEEKNIEKPKKGDHVQFSLDNQIVKGVIVEIENKKINNSEKTMALCIWDYYKGKNNIEHYRTGYSVCDGEKFKLQNPDKVYNNSDCIDGVTSNFDIGMTNCNNLSCELINSTSFSVENLGSYKNMSDSLMGEMLKNSQFSDVEKKLWEVEGWIDIDELERLHICQETKCKKGYFSCNNTVNNYIKL